jgi:tRNA (cmo5U34)-methyltransferase
MIKSTLKEIKERFDQDVERFSSLETGQSTMMNSGLVLDLFEAFAQETGVENPRVLDLGCGGGNLSLRLNRALPGGTYRLVDLSLKMLERAQERIVKAGGRVEDIYQGDLEAYTWPKRPSILSRHLRFCTICAVGKPGGGSWDKSTIH